MTLIAVLARSRRQLGKWLALLAFCAPFASAEELRSGYTTMSCGESLSATTHLSSQTPLVMDEIPAEGASGGYGIVYRSTWEDGQTAVAHKVAKTSEAETSLFRELHMLTLLNKRNPPESIPRLYGLRRNRRNQVVLVSEWIEGNTWQEQHLSSPVTGENFKERASAMIAHLRELSQTLKWLHEQGVLHLDVKPKNLMLTHDGKLKLVDFGIAVQDVGIPAETPVYTRPGGYSRKLAPEILYAFEGRKGLLSPKSDLYSLGLLTQMWLDTVKVKRGEDPLSWKTFDVIREMQSFADTMTQSYPVSRHNHVIMDEKLAQIEEAIRNL